MSILELIYSPAAYLLFHLVVIGSLVVSRLIYRQLSLPKILSTVSILVFASLPLVLLDIGVTGIWWDFNPIYVLSELRIFKLPLEEWLFFITVPLGLLVMHHNLASKTTAFDTQVGKYLSDVRLLSFFQLLCVGLILPAVVNGWWYTASMALFLLAVFQRMKNTNLFLSFGLVIMIGFLLTTTLIFNSYLTALPIVVYNPAYKTNIMVGPIPVEDFLFGLVLYLHLAVQYEICKVK